MPESGIADKPATTPVTETASSPPATPAPEKTASEAPPETNAASPSPQTTTEPASPAWWTALDSVDPKELLKHPKVAGTLGDLAQRRATEERKKWEADRARAEEENRLRALRDNDPFKYVEEEKRIEAESQKQAATQAQVYGDIDGMLNEMYVRLPEADQKELAGKAFGEGIAGRKAALEEFSKRLARKEVTDVTAKERAKWEKDAREAIRKEVLAEVNGKEPAPDTGGGQSAPGALTVEEFNRNRGDAQWRRDNRARIDTLLASMPVPTR